MLDMALDQIESFMHSLGALESGNNYGATGPYTGPRYGRARGRFQIMEKIYPAWAREAGVNPNDFSSAAQDKVARHKMSQYYRRYGSWDLVAVAWFAGPGRADQAKKNGISSVGGLKDMLGTDVTGYVQKVTAGMKGGTAAPTRNPDTGQAVRPVPRSQRLNWEGAEMADVGAIGGSRLRIGTDNPGSGDYGIRVLPDMEMPEEASDIEKSQIGQDTFGAILSTISDASKGSGGKVLDLKAFLGMPDRSQGMPIEEVEAELEAQPEVLPGAAPPGDGPMAEAPDHPGFAGLTDESKTWTQTTLGRGEELQAPDRQGCRLLRVRGGDAGGGGMGEVPGRQGADPRRRLRSASPHRMAIGG
jgi:hypothetical protein